jgi:hypothetical protein
MESLVRGSELTSDFLLCMPHTNTSPRTVVARKTVRVPPSRLLNSDTSPLTPTA